MKKFIAFAMLLLSIPSLSYSQSAKQLHQIDRIFSDRTEVYFSFRLSDRSQISQLTKMISIDNVKNDVVYAYANQQEFTRFVALNIRYEILTAPSRLSRQPMMETYDHQERTLNLTAYPTYPQYVAMMQQFATDYPDLCQLVNIGTTVNGRSLLVLKITDNVNVREYEPQFLYTSTMHGDETAGYIFMLNFIDWLLSGYGTDVEATQMVNSMELWINPLANPDGTYAGGDNTVNQAVRYNGNNVDLNRNYPDPQDGPHSDGNAYQPETMAFMAFADTMDFVMSANFHGGAEVFNYPWDTKITDHPDRDWWIAQGNEYVDTVHGNSGNNYMVDYFNGFDAPGVTNGFIWYEVNGGRQDYMNAYRHCREITIELSTTKLLPVADFSTYYSYNFESLKGWVNESLHGVNGLITDACDGHPIKAKVFVNNHDADSSHVFSSLPIGNYYRPIAPGNYSITYSAPGYQSVTLNNVTVIAEQGIVRDVQLQPLLPQAAFTAAPNAACGGNYQFTDLTGSALSWTWDFGDGSTSSEQNPLHEYSISGTYDVKLVVTNCLGTDTLIEPAFLNVSIIDQPILDADTLFSCVPQSYTINASGDGDITWYDAATGGNVVASGSTFTTALLNSPVTYYVSQQLTSDSAHVGLADNTIGTGAFYTAGTYRYLIFDAYQNFTLESVKVYANTAGNRTIELRDNNGVVLQSVTVMIPAGESRVTLNFSISAATGLQLGMAGANQMFRNQTGATYPYTLDGYLSITGNSANSAGAYYYYYDWKVIQSCTSNRVPVHIQIGNAQPISLEISTPTLNACEGSEVVFTAFSQNAFGPHYQWSVNGTAAGTDSPTFASSSLANGSVVSCVVSTTDNCSTNNPAQSNDVTIAVTPAPIAPQISLSNNVDLTSTVGSVQWYLNNQAIDGATSISYTAVSNGNYYAVTTSNGCPSLPSNMIEVTALSISEISLGAMMNIFPNPTSDLAYVQIMSQEPYLLQVTNSIGQVLISRQEKSNTSAVDLSGFEPGIYWIRAITSTETTQARILKK